MDIAPDPWHYSRAELAPCGVYDVLAIEPAALETVGAWSGRIHPQDVPGYENKIATALESGRGWTVTYRIRDAHGETRR